MDACTGDGFSAILSPTLMKDLLWVRPVVSATLLLLLPALLPSLSSVRAQGYEAGDIVNTNFSMVNRYLWTNHNGQVFAPSNSVVRLSDFDGRIVFFEFFAVW